MLLDRLSRREADATIGSDGKKEDGTADKASVRILPPSNENHMQQGK